jgi:sarcosine/dimethylglycine N-methyltransferase
MRPHSEIHARVLAQYSETGGAAFYRIVMGDGGAAIHYGHYSTPEVPMRDAVRASTAMLLEMAARHGGGHPLRIIDLGAGAGGSSHQVAAQTGARVTCVDLCADLNADNLNQAKAAGLGDQIETWHGSFDALPADWSAVFDLAWSQDALCHAPDKPAVFREIHRVLKPGGLFIFSDILRADSATAADVAAFTGVNAVDSLASPAETHAALHAAGFELLESHDWSDSLRANFTAMLAQITLHRTTLIAQGVPATRIDGFARSLERRLAWSENHVMCWAAFACRSKSR